MREKLSPVRAMLLGLFILIAGGVAAGGVFAIGRHGGLFTRTFTLQASFPAIGGVQEGTRVRVQGIDAGIVSRIEPPIAPGQQVVLHLQMNQRFQGLIRRDALAQLATQGLIGERVVELIPGTSQAPVAQDGDQILAESPIELSQLLAEAQQAGQKLQQLGQKLETALVQVEDLGQKMGGTMERVDGLVARVQKGEGSVGKFMMTDEAHHAALDMMRSGDKMMTTLDETLTAARRVWPLKDYFMSQGMNQPEDVLYRPGAKKEVRTFPSRDIFTPSTSVLSESGKKQLDEVATWLNGITHGESEVVVAVFDPTEESNLKAQRLTSEQAATVRDYLMNEHSVHKLGFWSRRSVMAAGFGNADRNSTASPSTPLQRVEIIAFVPVKS